MRPPTADHSAGAGRPCPRSTPLTSTATPAVARTKPSATTAVVAFSAISSAQLPAQISGIYIDVVLPPGVSVPTDPANPKQISATALVAGSALDSLPAANKVVMGSYSSAGRLVRISAVGPTGFGPGEYVRLTCVVAPGVTLPQSEVAALTASEFSAYSPTLVDLTGFLTPQFALR